MPTRRISLSNAELLVATEGRGAPLLLVHGFPLNHAMWRHQLAGLSDAAHVIAPDLRGFGGSSPAGPALTMARLADDLAELLAALEIAGPVAVAGHSMGGYVLWQFWKRHADRVGRLIVCNSRAAPDAPEAAENRRQLATRALNEGQQAVVEAFLPKLLGPTARREQPGLERELQAMMAATSPATSAAALQGMAERADARPWLAELGVGVLFLTGAEDGISTADENRGMAQAASGSRFVEIPGAGHMAPLERPQAVNAAIREFLSA